MWLFLILLFTTAPVVTPSSLLPQNDRKNASSIVSIYLTSCDQDGNPLTMLQPDFLDLDQLKDREIDLLEEDHVISIEINVTQRYQTMLGYGAGIPQSSVSVLLNLKEYSSEIYWNVMMKLFSVPSFSFSDSPDDNSNRNGNDDGAGFSILRFPMGSCDYSMTNTSYDETDDDYSLNNFKIDTDSQLILEFLKDVIKINPKITLIASPWTAPSWLKEWNSLLGLNNKNTLLSTNEAYQTYANYFYKTYEIFLSNGLNINYFTIQNEPLFGNNQQYPGMYLSAENEYQLGKLISQLFVSNNIKLLAYDHNWDHPEYPLEILQKQSLENSKNNIFDGIAWHCYGGDMITALQQIHSLYPQASQHITECTGSYPDSTCDITQGMTSFGWNHEWDMKNLFLGAARYGSSSGTKWILALDENCGPVLPGVEFTFGRPFVSIPLSLKSNVTMDDIQWNQDYWTTAHMSKFISPNDVRVDTLVTMITATGRERGSEGENQTSDMILSESFYNPLTRQVTCILMNLNHEQEQILSISQETVQFQYTVPPWSTVIFRWSEG
jgi:O-glycosyl hydrolase